MLEKLKEEVYKANIELVNKRMVIYTWGNVSAIDRKTNLVVIKPSSDTQTPQAFHLKDICDLHRNALEKGITNSVASCTLMIEMEKQVYFSVGSEKNIKLTTAEDFEIFKALLSVTRPDWFKC